MNVAEIRAILDIIVSYGTPLVITVGVLWILWRYIPKWIDSSIEAQTKVPIELAKLNDTLTEGVNEIREVKEHSTAVRQDMDQIKAAIRHGAVAGEKLVKAAVEGRNPEGDAMKEFQKMHEAVQNGE